MSSFGSQILYMVTVFNTSVSDESSRAPLPRKLVLIMQGNSSICLGSKYGEGNNMMWGTNIRPEIKPSSINVIVRKFSGTHHGKMKCRPKITNQITEVNNGSQPSNNRADSVK